MHAANVMCLLASCTCRVLPTDQLECAALVCTDADVAELLRPLELQCDFNCFHSEHSSEFLFWFLLQHGTTPRTSSRRCSMFSASLTCTLLPISERLLRLAAGAGGGVVALPA